MCTPELDQQLVQVQPFLNIHLPKLWIFLIWADDNTLKVFGFDGSEGHYNPLDGQPHPCPQELYMFEFCGLGEVKGNVPERAYDCK